MNSNSITTRSRNRRSGNSWISKNRVLNGGTKQKDSATLARNPNFDADETKVLIELWGDPKVQRHLITTHKKYTVIAELSAKMEEYGYFRTPEEITTRIKNLKCIYNRLKKEVESGECVYPSWRHFADMDAVMSRPIFSVRPNEVPAPSLRFQIEQEIERRKERKRRICEEGDILQFKTHSNIVSSDSDIDDIIDVLAFKEPTITKSNFSNSKRNNTTIHKNLDTNLVTHNDVHRTESGKTIDCNNDKLIDEDLLIKMENYKEDGKNNRNTDSKRSGGTKKTDSNRNRIEQNRKENEHKPIVDTNPNSKSKNINDTELLIPKMEPIDLNADDDPKVINSSNTSTVSSSSATVGIINKNTIPVQVSKANNSNSSLNNSQQGKISLVPTNFLMQRNLSSVRQQPQIRLLPNASGQLQPHVVLNAATVSTATSSSSAATGIVTASPVITKVLLVNTEQANKVSLPGTLAIAAGNIQTQVQAIRTQQHNVMRQQFNVSLNDESRNKQQSRQQIQAQLLPSQQQSKLLHKVTDEQTKLHETGASKKECPNSRVRKTKSQILTGRKLNNNIKWKRLELERKRFDWEKSAVEKFFSMFSQHLKQQTNLEHRLANIVNIVCQGHLQNQLQSQSSSKLHPTTIAPSVADSSTTTNNNRNNNSNFDGTSIIQTSSNSDENCCDF